MRIFGQKSFKKTERQTEPLPSIDINYGIFDSILFGEIWRFFLAVFKAFSTFANYSHFRICKLLAASHSVDMRFDQMYVQW